MTTRRPPRASAALHALALSTLALGVTPARGENAPKTAPVITVREPAGFADLTGDQTMMVDVYFGGVQRGEAMVRVSPGKLTFLNPAEVIGVLPGLSDPAAIRALLAGQPLATNAELACGQGADRSACGRLSPDTLGIIFDRDHFRVDVFLNPRFLTVQATVAERYLPAPGGGISAVSAIGAIASGQSGRGDDYYNFYDRMIVGDGERRLRAEVSVASKLGFQADTVAFEWDRPERRYSAGELWARGNDVSGRRKLIGAGIQTQIDTRLDKDEIYGSPIVVYLDQRARVDLIRDGQILSSAVYDAGNQRIDTGDMPDGSYEIVLRIQEPGQPAHEERRFFTKSQRIPSLGRTDFFAFGGMLVKGRNAGAFEPSNHPYAEGGVAHRLNQHWAVDGMLQATDHAAGGEIGATFITPIAQARAAVIAQTDGTTGELVQLASTGNSRINFNFDLRHIDRGRIHVPAPGAFPAAAFGSPYLDDAIGSYSQASGYLSYSMATLRVAASGTYRSDRGSRESYSVGPSVEWDMLRTGRLQLTLHGDFAATDRGDAGFAGVSLRLLGPKYMVTAQGGGRSSTIKGDDIGDGVVGSIGGTWTNTVAGGELALGAGYQHQPRQDNAILSSEFRHPLAQLSGEFVRSKEDALPAVDQYSLGFQTTVTVGGGAIKVAGRSTTDSMIVAGVEGARAGDRFDLLVNDQVAGTIVGTRTVALSLADYRRYEVRIRPAGGPDAMSYDSSVRTVGLYPGVVARLSWSASPITIKYGRLVNPDGTPLAGASITGRGAWTETDEDGYFQLEAPDDAPLTVTTKGGHSYSITLPATHGAGEIAKLGSVVCCGAEEVRLGVLDQTGIKGSQ